jgi:hypothetical protein
MSIYFCTRFRNQNIQVKEVYDSLNQKANFKFRQISDQGEKYEIKGYLPYTEYSKLNDEIDSKIDTYISNFKKNIDINTAMLKPKYTMNVSFVAYEYNEYVSYVFTVEMDIGLAHPNEYIFTVNYDTKNNKIVTISDLVKKNNGILKMLSKYSYDVLKQNPKIKEANQEELLVSGTKGVESNFEDFVFSNDGIIVFFEKYSVAPFSYGEFSVVVPYSRLDI